VTNRRREDRPAKRITSKNRSAARPPDDYYAEFKPTKRFIFGRSFVGAPDLLVPSEEAVTLRLGETMAMVERDAASGAAGARPMSAYVPRPCLKMVDKAVPDNMEGAALTIVREVWSVACHGVGCGRAHDYAADKPDQSRGLQFTTLKNRFLNDTWLLLSYGQHCSCWHPCDSN
jgi:hypothetical protein